MPGTPRTDPIADDLNLGALFVQHGKTQQVARGCSVFAEGQPYNGIYLIARGTFKWFRMDAAGNECVLKTYAKGEIAGLPPLFNVATQKKYVATLMALTDGAVIHWGESRFHTFMRRHPEWLLVFNRQYSSTMVDLIEQTASISMKNVPDRLYDFLLRLGAASDWVALPYRKHQLAATLNTSPESLSRAFAMLRRQQKIETKAKQYRVLPQDGTANAQPA